MSGVLKGIAAYKADQKAKAERAAQRDRPKANWFKLPQDASKTVRFLQELDESAENYDPDRGVATHYVEHNGPGDQGWQRHARCTIDSEGMCFPCEQRGINFKEWPGLKQNFYINVLEEDGTVSILSRSSSNAFVQALYQEHEDSATDNDNNGSITDKVFRITRTGTGTGTNWLLKPLPRAEVFDDSNVTVWNLDEYIPNVPYEKQPKFFGVEGAVVAKDEDTYEEAGASADW